MLRRCRRVLISLPPEQSGIARPRSTARRWRFDLAPPGAIWYLFVQPLRSLALRFDLAPPGAIWYRDPDLSVLTDIVLISLPPEQSGINCDLSASLTRLRFDLAPPGAIWYPIEAHVSGIVSVLISLPPEQSGITSGGYSLRRRGFDLAPPGAIWYPSSECRRSLLSFDLAPPGAIWYHGTGMIGRSVSRFDLAPPGAIWYRGYTYRQRWYVLISLPPEQSGIAIASSPWAMLGFDLAPPGAIWYPDIDQLAC